MTEAGSTAVFANVRRVLSRASLFGRALSLRALPPAHPRRCHPPHHLLLMPSRRGRRIVVALASVATLLLLGCGGLWWRLASGPVSLDLVTPWLISALEERLGGGQRIEVGGTVLERDEDGRTAVRLRDIVLRDAAGTMVASAPKAEVGIATMSLLAGRLRAERLSLIGAQMAVRIESDGQLTVFAGSAEPVAVAAAGGPAATGSVSALAPSETDAPANNLFATLIGWLQTLDGSGLDGRDLIEVGLKNGSIAIDDRRTGRQIGFGNINLSLARLSQGGVALAVASSGADGPWSLNATVTPRPEGGRAVEAVLRDLSPKDIMLAFRVDAGDFEADVPLSAVVRAEIGADGAPQSMQGRIVAGAGFIGDAQDKEARILIDEAQAELRWNAEQRVLEAPIEIHSGASHIALATRIEPPQEPAGRWGFSVSHGMATLATRERQQEPPLMLDRISLRGVFDAAKRRIEVEKADLRGAAGGVAVSGAFDYSGPARLVLGVAGTRMPASAFKRLWPAVVAPALRNWIEQHLLGGTVERVEIAVNAPLSALKPNGTPLQPDWLSIDILSRGTVIQPVSGLPVVKDVEVVTRVVGRVATVSFGPSEIELPSGRKLSLAAGTFEVADINAEPSIGRTRLRIDGAVDSAAELLAMEPVREAASLPFDAGASRGTVVAQVAIVLPLMKTLSKRSVNYAVEAELAGFSAEKFIRGQKAEAGTLRISANPDTLQIKGDLKIGGTPASVEYRKGRADAEAELRVQTTLDDAARARLGFDFDGQLTGPLPVKLSGRVKLAEREGRLSVDADLTQAKVTELLPGWNKQPGRAARASFVMVDRGQSMRLEDFVLDGPGVSVKGTIEVNSGGEILHANLPSFAVSDGDKASLKADRGSDGVLKVVLRGDLYDGRGLVKTAVAGQKPELRNRSASQDIDLDIKLGAITGHHGEALRAFELRMSRRGGQIRSFTLAGGLGANARLAGDMRGRGNGQRVMYVETTDAGALFRFTDTYPRIYGGTMSVAMEPPTTDNLPQDGLLNIRDFSVRGEAALDRVAANQEAAAGAPVSAGGGGVAFSRMRVEFTRSPGRFAIRDGVVWGPAVGATIDGTLDYFRDEVRLRGTFVPAYGLNNMFSRLPLVGMFLGGGANEGLLGITYQVVGSPRAPMLQVNPMSAVAPGFLRKLFEFRGAEERTGRISEPTR